MRFLSIVHATEHLQPECEGIAIAPAGGRIPESHYRVPG